MTLRSLCLLGALGLASAPTVTHASFYVTDRTVTIRLGPFINGIVPNAAQPPVTVAPGTRLKFEVEDFGLAVVGPVRWRKDTTTLAATGVTLEVVAETARYSAFYQLSNGEFVSSEPAPVLVSSRQGPRLINSSNRARVGPEAPFFLSGFVIESGVSGTGTLLLVRGVGPTLGAYGVTGTLAAPQVRVLDAQGQEIAPRNTPFTFPSIAEATQRVGAFPLAAGGKDVANLYYLPAGAFVAQLSSADGGVGTALLEVYEVPL